MLARPLLLCLAAGAALHAAPDEGRLKTLYARLDPHSVQQHLAFYSLYPDSDSGRDALATLTRLLSVPQLGEGLDLAPLSLSSQSLEQLIALWTADGQEAPELDGQTLELIEVLGGQLAHRKLAGHQVWDRQALLDLPEGEIDIARSLFLLLLGDRPDGRERLRHYEASLDLMALQVRARLPEEPSPQDIVDGINRLLFYELRYRFPPHSSWSDDVDIYTFLPQVLDSRRGVCLGVSSLYLCLAQRLGLDLELVTPPGHIYVRYKSGDELINIETTARGVHLPDEVYTGVNTRSLNRRSKRELLGLTFFNLAARQWHDGDHKGAIASYLKAVPFLEGDLLLQRFLAYNYLFDGQTEQGESLLRQLRGRIPEDAVADDDGPEDYLSGRVDAAGLKLLYSSVDESLESLKAKKGALEEVLRDYPEFRAGWVGLATLWLQLGRRGEALAALQRRHELGADDPNTEYYLAALSLRSWNYPAAWRHLHNVEQLSSARGHHPRALKELRRELRALAPE